MNTLINSPSFQIIGVTLISSLMGIFVKWASRNDQHGSFKQEDLAIGLELCVTSIVLLITDTVNDYNRFNSPETQEQMKLIIQANLQSTPWLILFSSVVLWVTSTVIRKLGWNSATELNRKWGILFPNLVGLVFLVLTFTWIKN